MPSRIDEKDVLFSTFAEITSLISLGRDNRVIFNKILNIALDLLPARKIYLIYVDDHRIVKYSGEKQERGQKDKRRGPSRIKRYPELAEQGSQCSDGRGRRVRHRPLHPCF